LWLPFFGELGVIWPKKNHGFFPRKKKLPFGVGVGGGGGVALVESNLQWSN